MREGERPTYSDSMLFADLVATSAAVAATPKRGEKIARLAELVRRLGPEEGPPGVAVPSGDLAAAARIALAQGEPGLAAVTLEVGRPVLPMLASTSADPESALAATGAASVEWKIDGARIQVHRAGSDVRIFTRNLNDVSD